MGEQAAPVFLQPPLIDMGKWNTGEIGAVAYDPRAGKAYVGTWYGPRRLNLLVFDVAADGTIDAAPRKYADHPEAVPSNQWSRVRCLLLDTKHRKLFLGVDTSVAENPPAGSLVMYDLDDRGEPTGSPQAFAIGSPFHNCNALALHPTRNRLYAAAWGLSGVSVVDRDDGGRPTGEPVVYPVAGYGKNSITVRPDGSRIYLGTYPNTVQVCDLDASGNLTTNAPRQRIVKGQSDNYLALQVNARGIYFTLPGQGLQVIPLDGKGDPVGEPATDSGVPAQAVAVLDDARILVAQPHTFVDALTVQPRPDGFQLQEMALDNVGLPSRVLRTGPVFKGLTVDQLALEPQPVITGKPIEGFIGNRFAGLLVRARLVAMDNTPKLPVTKTTTSFGQPETYLSFAYSPARGTVYSVLGESLLVARIRADAADTPGPIPCPNATGVIALDDAEGRLYAARRDGGIAVFALQADGTVTDAATVLDTGVRSIALLRVNPQTRQLYVFGAEAGAPRTRAGVPVVPVLSPAYLVDAVVDAERGRIYGAHCPSNTNIRVWRLAADGTLAPESPNDYADGLNTGAEKQRSQACALKLDGRRQRLYYTVDTLADVKGQFHIGVYALNQHGDPVGQPRLGPSPLPNGAVLQSLELSRNGRWLFVSGSGIDTFYAHQLDGSGDLTGKVDAWFVGGGYGKGCLTLSADGRQLLMGTYPSKLDLIRLAPDGQPTESVRIKLQLDRQEADLGSLAVGDTSAWVSLDQGLKDGAGTAFGYLRLDGGRNSGNLDAQIGQAALELEIARTRDGSTRTLTTLDVRLEENSTVIFLPRYGTEVTEEKLPELIQTTETRIQGYLGTARRCAVPPPDRPKQFIVATGLYPLSSRQTLVDLLDTIIALGHNTVGINKASAPSLPAPTVHAEARQRGITQFVGWGSLAQYFFVSNQYLEQWAGAVHQVVAGQQGAKPEEVALLHFSDEPAWYYPGELNRLASNPEHLAEFCDYLKSKGMTPALLGKTSWDQVLPVSRSRATTAADKRTFYWAMRFFPEQFSQTLARATRVMQERYGTNVFTTTNFNNWPGRYVRRYNTDQDRSEDSGMGMPDWFLIGRQRGVTCLWTEDWFWDGSSQLWSLYADLMRCAGRAGGTEFGGYVVGHCLGQIKNGAGGKYKIMALMGHGAKALETYTFGPTMAFGDGWSENRAAYPSYAAGLRLLGRSEPLTWPGRPRHGTVAILFPQASQVWDRHPDVLPIYQQELYGLHAALIHQQYPVDFVDDTDVENGALAKYRYAALYVTAPNLSARAQQAILDWVQHGGTVVLLPGAGTANEYDEPMPILAGASGVTWRQAGRPDMPVIHDIPKWPLAQVTVTEPAVRATGDQVRFPTAPLQLIQARALAEFADGQAAWAQADCGRGRIYSFGYWPGASYWYSPDRSDLRELPAGWSAAGRAIITAPARMAGAKKHVSVSADLVEGALLESDQGIAVTLLNWLGTAQRELTVSVAVSDRLRAEAGSGALRVASLEQGTLSYRLVAGELQVKLPLDTVDVVMIRPRKR